MAFLRTFFDLNHSIVLFSYGLVFFVLGLAIALQSRRYSRLDLARSLSWLAAFGFTHGLHEWGDLFIPIQGAYLSEPAVQGLKVIQPHAAGRLLRMLVRIRCCPAPDFRPGSLAARCIDGPSAPLGLRHLLHPLAHRARS